MTGLYSSTDYLFTTLYKCNVHNPYTSVKLNYWNFHPLEVVSGYRDPQFQVSENYSYLFNLNEMNRALGHLCAHIG